MVQQEILQKYEPRASVVPAELNFMDCPYMWPFCTQPLYAGAMPLMFNATVLNGMGLTGGDCSLSGSGQILPPELSRAQIYRIFMLCRILPT